MRRRLVWAFLRSRVGLALHDLIARPASYHHRCPICAWVWRELESDPTFRSAIARAEADFREGRAVRYRAGGQP